MCAGSRFVVLRFRSAQMSMYRGSKFERWRDHPKLHPRGITNVKTLLPGIKWGFAAFAVVATLDGIGNLFGGGHGHGGHGGHDSHGHGGHGSAHGNGNTVSSNAVSCSLFWFVHRRRAQAQRRPQRRARRRGARGGARARGGAGGGRLVTLLRLQAAGAAGVVSRGVE